MINFLDILFILLFVLLFVLILKRYWFYSLYSFLRFVLFALLSLGIGLFLSSVNPYSFFLTKLQIALLITGIAFTLLWKFVSFKKIFFWLDTHLFKIDRFVYFHKLNKIINIPPSLIASSFFVFFLFSILLSVSPYSTFIQGQIEGSKIIKPLSFKIYFSPIEIGKINPFEGTIFQLPPAISSTGKDLIDAIRRPYFDLDTSTRINQEREAAGLPPLTPTEQIPTQAPSSPTTQPSGKSGSQPNSQTTPIIIKFPGFPNSPNPTATPTQTSQPTTPTPTSGPGGSTSIPTSTPMPIPTSTPTPIPTAAPKDTRTIEQRIFELTNEKRSENGIRALSWSEDIAAVARSHSQDMKDRNYFAHNSPDGVTPFQRLTMGGISYTTAGENIATAGTAELIVTAWMNSPGHKANILNAAFGRIGIGVVENSRYGLMATQNFTN